MTPARLRALRREILALQQADREGGRDRRQLVLQCIPVDMDTDKRAAGIYWTDRPDGSRYGEIVFEGDAPPEEWLAQFRGPEGEDDRPLVIVLHGPDETPMPADDSEATE